MSPESAPNQAAKLADVLPSNAEIERENDSVRKDILAAIQRILLGHPKHVPPGATSVSDLAKEATVGRHYLYQRHPDLRYRYEFLRDRASQPTEKEVELQLALDRTKKELAKLRELQSKTSQEAKDWKGLSELLAQGINALQESVHQQQIRAERVVRELKRLQDGAGAPSPVVLMHRRHNRQAEPS